MIHAASDTWASGKTRRRWQNEPGREGRVSFRRFDRTLVDALAWPGSRLV